MCTLSWLRTPQGYTVFMNRDEQRRRSRAEPPAVRSLGESLVVSPRDPDGGGSWISVNDAGLTVALLNRRFEARRPGMVSRGQVVTRLSPCVSQSGALEVLASLDLSALAPFALALVEPHRPVTVIEWDGHSASEAQLETDGLLLTSSSLDHAGASEARQAALARLRGDGPLAPSVLDALHRDHGSERRLSACMHRDDAVTMSLSRIDVGRETAVMRYEPGSPCEHHDAVEVSIARRHAAMWQAAS